jgi:hypothetical protein
MIIDTVVKVQYALSPMDTTLTLDLVELMYLCYILYQKEAGGQMYYNLRQALNSHPQSTHVRHLIEDVTPAGLTFDQFKEYWINAGELSPPASN